MNTTPTRKSRGFARVAPALGLACLAPLVAEFLMGNIPLTHAYGFIGLIPLYGCGALLIREVARRTGRGWPTMLVWAVAYGVFEEAFLAQTLWIPDWGGARILDYGFVPALGTAVPWFLFVVAVHTVFSISVPITLVESLTPTRRTTPWLGRVGIGVTAGLFATICVTGFVGTTVVLGSSPSAAQLGVSAVVVVALVAVGWFAGRATVRPSSPRVAPSPWLVGGFALVTGAAFVLLYAVDPTGLSPWLAIPLPAWASVLLYLALFALVAAVVYRWSHRAGWSDGHRLALAGGALLTYAWHSFPWQTMSPTSSLLVDLAGNAVFAAGAVTLLVVAAVRLRNRQVDQLKP